MGFTKDLWTRPEEQPDGKIKRVPNARWGKGKRWLACWSDPDGNERTQAFKGKVPADRYWAKMETDRERGEYFDPKAGKATFDGIAQRWLSSRMVDPASKIRYQSLYRLHVKPTFGKNNRQVKSIKPSEVQAWQADLSERFAASTVSGARLVLLGILDLAVADDAIKKNPAASKVIQAAKTGGGEKLQAWSAERVFGMIDAHPDAQRLLPIIGSSCGLREGELFGLAIEDIDFDERVLHVRRQIKKLGKSYVFALPKSDSERVVPLPDWTAQSIRVHIGKYPPRACSLPWEKPEGKLRTHNILVRWINGNHMSARSYAETMWKPALVTAGIIGEPVKDARGRKKYVTTRREGTHQLRHHYASTMLAGGASIKELAEYLGHHDASYTLAIYSHLMPDSHDRARRIIDERLFRPRAVSES
ncbi:MAG TPA: tyrosine-type recombinase/integrase [Aeromicrobium sp.]|nr:tyrosine-type recombinase/integrase [Aeromicrobium sp.]